MFIKKKPLASHKDEKMAGAFSEQMPIDYKKISDKAKKIKQTKDGRSKAKNK